MLEVQQNTIFSLITRWGRPLKLWKDLEPAHHGRSPSPVTPPMPRVSVSPVSPDSMRLPMLTVYPSWLPWMVTCLPSGAGLGYLFEDSARFCRRGVSLP